MWRGDVEVTMRPFLTQYSSNLKVRTGRFVFCVMSLKAKAEGAYWNAPDRAAQPRPAYARSGARVGAKKRLTVASLTCQRRRIPILLSQINTPGDVNIHLLMRSMVR